MRIPGQAVDESTQLEVIVATALAEDLGTGDVTSLWSVPPGRRGRARVLAREALVVSGLQAVREVFRQVEPGLEVHVSVSDGEAAGPGDEVLSVEGALQALLAAERTALNFLGRLSGIATLTRAHVELLRGSGTRVLDTRKTTPGLRHLEKAAVRHGGGTNHRFGLHDMVLLKENHLAAAGGVAPALEAVAARNRSGLPVEVEVRGLEELAAVRPFVERTPPAVQRVLLDNMSPEELDEAVARVRAWSGPVELEASGNLGLDTLPRVAASGVDFVSVGALTHSAPVADLSLLLEGA